MPPTKETRLYKDVRARLRGDPYFVAFDLLQVNGRDLRRERLIDRKHELERITTGLSPILYAEHIEQCGTALFNKACELDLEGIVAKDGRAPYDRRQTTWFKIRNREYSQMVGREEVFERERHQEPVAGGTRALWRAVNQSCNRHPRSQPSFKSVIASYDV
jgi:ATP-dependent DNA ligase